MLYKDEKKLWRHKQNTKGRKRKKNLFQKSSFFDKQNGDKQFSREFRILAIFDSRKFLRMG